MIKLSEIVAPHFHDYFFNDTTHVIDYGGRGSGKTSKNAIRVVVEVITKENINVVSMRKHKENLRRSVYTDILKAFKRFGITDDLLEATVAPFGITYKPNGNKILFTGVDDADKVKGMVGEKPITLLFIDEITEFFKKSYNDGLELLRNIELTFSRGTDTFQCLYCFNPPSNPNHPIYTYISQHKTHSNYLIKKTNYLGLPKEWLGNTFIEEAEKTKNNDEPLYEYLYLGTPHRMLNAIYKLNDKHVKTEEDIESLRFDYLTVGIDIGDNKSYTTAVLSGFINNFDKCVVIDEWMHRNYNLKQSQKKDQTQYIYDIIQKIKEWRSKYGFLKVVYIDSARPDFILNFKRQLQREGLSNYIGVMGSEKMNKRLRIKTVADRIHVFKHMMALDLIYFSEKVSRTIQSIKTASWDAVKYDNGINEREDISVESESTDTCYIDLLDAMEYAIMSNALALMQKNKVNIPIVL